MGPWSHIRRLPPIALCITLSLSACGGGGGDSGGVGGGGGGAAQSELVVSALAPTHGQAGTLVTLTGSGFSTVLSENVVTLNNKPCTVDSATATELKVIIPANAGSGNFQVTVLSKTAQSSTFTYDLNFVTVSTLAGAQIGSLDGVGAAAQFRSPSGLALNAAGFLFVGDTGNHRIRVVSAAGSVGTFAGNTDGLTDGTGLLAQFSAPDVMVFDSAGNLIVADPGNNTIRKVSPAALVTTFVRDTAGLSGPFDLAFDSSDNLYVADTGNHRIVKIDSSGAVTTFAGGTAGAADGTGSAAQFHFPTAWPSAATATCSSPTRTTTRSARSRRRAWSPRTRVASGASRSWTDRFRRRASSRPDSWPVTAKESSSWWTPATRRSA